MGEFGKLNEVLAINGTLDSIARLVVAYWSLSWLRMG